MSSSKLFIIISDANVLIDYLKSNEAVISLAAATMFDIYLPIPVLDKEIEQLSEAKAKKLGIKLYEPTLAELKGALSGS